MVADNAGGKEGEGVSEEGVERISGPRSDKVTGKWRRLHNEELNDLYCSPNIVRVIISNFPRAHCHTLSLNLKIISVLVD